MLRALFRLMVLCIILVVVGVLLLGWRGEWFEGLTAERRTDTAARIESKARETGAVIGEKAATAAAEAEAALASGRLTAKIKAKMALDDRIRARAIDVDTAGSVVTLSGEVSSEAQRQRALQLARETDGVTQVVDRLRVMSAERH